MLGIVIAFLLVALVFLAIAKQRLSQGSSVALAFRKEKALFSPAERSFLGVLDQAVGNDFRILGKVRVADVIMPAAGQGQSKWKIAFNKITQKHFDFVLCKTTDLSIVAAIELNDQSHRAKNRQVRDDFLQAACLSAKLPLIMFEAKAAYTVQAVADQITAVLKPPVSEVPTPEKQIKPVEPSLLPFTSEVTEQATPVCVAEASSPNVETTPTCPRCASELVKRIAKGGSNAGHEFWGCSNFPQCRYILKI